jgi:hypothetical protein
MIRVALPCLRFPQEERRIINEHGFITFPQFLDNHYISLGKPQIKWLQKQLQRYGCGFVEFAVAPDYEYEQMRKLKNQYPHINWIFPLHSVKEDFNDFEWVGMPYDKPRRDYDLQTFLKITEGKKRWFLGVWESIDPHVLLLFDGFDTTIPETYSGKYGKIWLDWGKRCDVSDLGLPTIEIFEFNVISFKIFLLKLFREKSSFANLQSFMVVEAAENVQP